MSVGSPSIEPALLGLTSQRYAELRNVFDVQSCMFTSEILSTIWDLYPEGKHNISVLDVGTRTGAGSELIRYLHNTASFSRLKVRITALDISSEFLDYAKVHFPDLTYVVQDILAPTFTDTFDVVLCSHTLEHLADPNPVVARLKQLACDWVVIATPFEEKDLIKGHLSSIGFKFLERHNACRTKVYRSMTWHQSMACIATLKGKAP